MYIPYTDPRTQVLHDGRVVLRDQLGTRYGREALFAKQSIERKSVEWIIAVVLGAFAVLAALIAG